MITIKDKTFKIEGISTPYNYSFSTTNACTTEFSNQSGTVSTDTLSTDISFGDRTCLQSSTSNVLLTLVETTGCSTNYNINITDVCLWMDSLGPIIKISDNIYQAPIPDVLQGASGSYSYNWFVPTGLDVVGVNTSNTITINKNTLDNQSTYVISLQIIDDNTGCSTTISFTQNYCTPTVNNINLNISCNINSLKEGYYIQDTILSGNSCDDSDLDWTSLEVVSLSQDISLTKLNNNISSPAVQLAINQNLESGIYELYYKIYNTSGIESNTGIITITYTKCFNTPVITSNKTITAPVACNPYTITYYKDIDFTGFVDELILSNPSEGTVSYNISSNNESFSIVYTPSNYNNSSDSFEFQLGYLGMYSANNSINIFKSMLNITGVVQTTNCTNNKHDATVNFDYNLPSTQVVSISVGDAFSVGQTLNVGAGNSSQLITNITCNGNQVDSKIAIGNVAANCFDVFSGYTTPVDITSAINFNYGFFNNAETEGTCNINLRVAGAYNNINGGFLEVLINGNMIRSIGNNGCCTCTTALVNNESGSFDCTYIFDTTGIPTINTIEIRSTVDNTVVATKILAYSTGC